MSELRWIPIHICLHSLSFSSAVERCSFACKGRGSSHISLNYCSMNNSFIPAQPQRTKEGAGFSQHQHGGVRFPHSHPDGDENQTEARVEENYRSTASPHFAQFLPKGGGGHVSCWNAFRYFIFSRFALQGIGFVANFPNRYCPKQSLKLHWKRQPDGRGAGSGWLRTPMKRTNIAKGCLNGKPIPVHVKAKSRLELVSRIAP